jgi:4-hydroxy-3-methylbut-2-en-1-yl diphosphate synthase IspG/GcpE
MGCDLVNAVGEYKAGKIGEREKKRKLLAKGAEYFSIPEDDEVPLIIHEVTVDLIETFCPSCNGSGKHVTRVDAFMWTPEENLPNCSICGGSGKISVPINAKKCPNCGRIQFEHNTICWECKHDFHLDLSIFIHKQNMEACDC